MSFIAARSHSISFGGPDEEFTGRELTCMSPSGQEIGTAVLVEQIASAGFSHVYKAFLSGDGLDGRVVAAKVLTTGYSHTAARAEPLLKRLYDRELAALTAVQHHHVIELVGVGEISTEPDSPEQPDTPNSKTTGHGIDDQLQSPARPSPSRPHRLSNAIFSSDMDCHQAHLNSYSAYNTPPFLPFHRPLESTHSGASGLNASVRETTELPSQTSVNIRVSPSLPSMARLKEQSPFAPGSAPGSAPVQHPGSPQDLSSRPLTSASGLGDGQDSSLSQPGIPGTPQRDLSSHLKRQGSNTKQSFFARLQQHRPMPSLTFSTRRSMASVPGGGPAATRRVLFIQWMSGGDARTLVDQAMRPMPEEAAATIILPILQALSAAHKAGIVHRDVKAGNILLAPGPRQVRLADWGISVHEAESSSRMSSSGGVVRAPGSVGTEYWCAPEIELGQAHDHKSDMFSVAITFIELVTGRDPRYDNSAEGFAKGLTDSDIGLIPQFLSEDCLGWLVPCLSVEPGQRPSAEELLQHPYFVSTLARMDEEEAAMAEEEEEEEGLEVEDGVRRSGDVRSGSHLQQEESLPIPVGINMSPGKASVADEPMAGAHSQRGSQRQHSPGALLMASGSPAGDSGNLSSKHAGSGTWTGSGKATLGSLQAAISSAASKSQGSTQLESSSHKQLLTVATPSRNGSMALSPTAKTADLSPDTATGPEADSAPRDTRPPPLCGCVIS